MGWGKQKGFEANKWLFGLGRATPEPCRAARDQAEKEFVYCPQDTAALGCVEPFYFSCARLAWGCQRCCIVGTGVTSLQMWLSFGEVHLGPGVKRDGFTPPGAARDKRLLDPALDTESFRLAHLG